MVLMAMPPPPPSPPPGARAHAAAVKQATSVSGTGISKVGCQATCASASSECAQLKNFSGTVAAIRITCGV